MTTTSPELWTVIPSDGISYPLQTLAKNINTWGGEKQGVIPLRGSDVVVPWVPGAKEIDRVPDSRSLGFQMWVLGCDDDGNPPPLGTSAHIQFVKNWRTITRIFWNKGRIFSLKKDFYDESGVMQTAIARGRYQDGLTPEMMGQSGAKFTVDVWLADPFFYGDSIDLPFDTSVATDYIVPVLGDYYSRKITINAIGGSIGCQDLSITISTDDPTQVLSLPTFMDSGQTLIVDVANQYAQLGSSPVSVFIEHEGQDDWLRVPPGTQTLHFDRTAGDWAGTFSYLPTWT